ncbi:MAG: hypothetical protein KUA43_19550 [Hoeflea sp.]|uniref:hypothetical protein n=1 Tax=Hoeflea sp. TaxID=1940281 RepID=UPI001E012BC8|nr:hypothetical protein [Hoeflea sp.]MBU4527363.1 hypothetical protein [Alphaproteobacteria bacterium]MBU4546854.1 hypothetical protein [Alphaproteobacteria bacterium]MBU4551634.1 hypothetical protein [Alphaproteobacteria bacterium]MBV1725639.1 hypothetical protein [Hoeflea sp.]
MAAPWRDLKKGLEQAAINYPAKEMPPESGIENHFPNGSLHHAAMQNARIMLM